MDNTIIFQILPVYDPDVTVQTICWVGKEEPMFNKIPKFACAIAVILLTAGLSGQPTEAGETTAGMYAAESEQVLSNQICYTVQPGDTLSEIAARFEVPLVKLIRSNNLNSSLIHPDEVLVIPDSTGSVPVLLSRGEISREDLLLLARAIHAEARGESFTGQVAVGAVILNRMISSQFPNSIREVVMQNNNNLYQFSPVADGTINLPPNETAINAAIQALGGYDPTRGALFFYNPDIAKDKWIFNLPVKTRIGNHLFA